MSCQLSDCGSSLGHYGLLEKIANENTIPIGGISALLYEECHGAYQAHVIQIHDGYNFSHRIAREDEHDENILERSNVRTSDFGYITR